MPFDVQVTSASAGDRSGDVFTLADSDGTVRAEVWPQWGFNCLRWQVRQNQDRWGDLIYTAPDWASNPVPTRSGHPILFPFPGRLRDGTLTFDGRTYSLPHNDSTQQHAIHGFTPRNRWRVTDRASTNEFAAITGEFGLKSDLPEAVSYWPANFNLAVTYRLFADRLRVESRVHNRGPGSLPFGLGYHPYFRLPDVLDPNISRYVLKANVSEVWEATDSLPTGRREIVSGGLDFRQPTRIGATALDHVFTIVSENATRSVDLVELAELAHPDTPRRLRILASPAFRELVLFTPPHRHAIAIEPYTCSADAANLAARGIDSGWRVLGPDEEWESAVEYRWEIGSVPARSARMRTD